MRALVLASTSPYRKMLLTRLRLPFEAVSPHVDETPYDGEPPADLVKRLARQKAQAGSAGRSNALIIGCDQCAVCDRVIMGKPGNLRIAFQQLKQAAGHAVTFHTGLCLLDVHTGKAQVDDVTAILKLRQLSDTQIATYLRKEAPYHCTGSIMSEGLGVTLIEQFQGDDPSALIGLPLIRLVSMLAYDKKVKRHRAGAGRG
jgi:septum formation protein